ncbi:AroB 3-dehydroquinate synthetase [actinobacterium SCGC AAA044-D11]
MKSIKVKAEHEYNIDFVTRWNQAFSEITKAHDKVIVITPSELASSFDLNALNSARVKVIETPAGEAAKSPEYLLQLWQACGDFGLTRSDAIVGIGGGSTTDLAGFVAATWLRGVSWYAIPTSLAGMVDAAIGGKTGINSAHGKNLIGSFFSPRSVIIDQTFLKTLSARDFNAGMAEVIKAGFIDNSKILELAPNAVENISELIWLSIDMKARVVSQDFRESKAREILNYGHTLGHAVEKIEDYKLRHGEAISIGLVFAAELSNVTGHLSREIVNQHRELLSNLDLPIAYEKSALPKLLDLMASDKKARGNTIRFIGISDIAKPVWLETVTADQIATAYERIAL